MPRIPRRYAIHLILGGGHREVVHFATLEAFQQWYQGSLHASPTPEAFINVPISELDGEYLLVRANQLIAIRVEPQFAMNDD